MSFGPPRSTGRVDDQQPEPSPLAGLCRVRLAGTKEMCTNADGHDGSHSWVDHPKHQARIASVLTAPSAQKEPLMPKQPTNAAGSTIYATEEEEAAMRGFLDNYRSRKAAPPAAAAPAPSPFALTVEDQRFCAANGIDPAAFAQTRAQEIADRQQREREEAAARKPAPAIVAPRAVLTEDDRRFCERMQIDEATFLATRQAELDERARQEAYRRS